MSRAKVAAHARVGSHDEPRVRVDRREVNAGRNAGHSRTEVSRHHCSQRRPVTRRVTGDLRRGRHHLMRLPACDVPVRIVIVVKTVQRSQQRQLVGIRGETRHQLADFDAGHVGGDRPELATNLCRGLRFQIVHVEVRRSSGKQHVNDALCPAAAACPFAFRLQDIRQSQTAQPEGSDLHPAAARDSVAVK